MNKKNDLIFIVMAIAAFASMVGLMNNAWALPPGTQRVPIYTDGTNVLLTPVVFSNQFVVVPTPSISNHVARLMDLSSLTNGLLQASDTNLLANTTYVSNNFLFITGTNSLVNTTTFDDATNRINFSFNMQNQKVIGNSNSLTFAHRIVPNGMTQTVTFVDMLLLGGTFPGTNQVVRIFNATSAATLLVTNSTWRGTIALTNGTRWYARFENNSSTNISVSASINGFTK